MKKILIGVLFIAGGIASSYALSLAGPEYLSPQDEELTYNFDYYISEQNKMLGILLGKIENPRGELKTSAVEELEKIQDELRELFLITKTLSANHNNLIELKGTMQSNKTLHKIIDDSEEQVLDVDTEFKNKFKEAQRIFSSIDNFATETAIGDAFTMDNEEPEGIIGTPVFYDENDQTPAQMDKGKASGALKEDEKDILQKAKELLDKLFNGV